MSNIAEFSNFLKLTIADDKYEIVPKLREKLRLRKLTNGWKQSEFKIEDTSFECTRRNKQWKNQ
jgi:hypothetical protein